MKKILYIICAAILITGCSNPQDTDSQIVTNEVRIAYPDYVIKTNFTTDTAVGTGIVCSVGLIEQIIPTNNF